MDENPRNKQLECQYNIRQKHGMNIWNATLMEWRTERMNQLKIRDVKLQ